ncbi:zinc finger A20 and AN1 domain-containing stress-associated protein 4-like protein [Tanacetum coccineum]
MSTAKLAVEKSLSLPNNQPETSSASSSDVVTDHLVVVNKVTNSVPDPVAVKSQPRNRYAEMHACTFDFKAMGKEAIAKANPVIKAEKLNKI